MLDSNEKEQTGDVLSDEIYLTFYLIGIGHDVCLKYQITEFLACKMCTRPLNPPKVVGVNKA